jgi:hypothetical protein
MGITWDDVPSMAFNMLDQTVIPYPQGKLIEVNELLGWFDGIVRRKDKDALKFKEYHRKIEDRIIYD